MHVDAYVYTYAKKCSVYFSNLCIHFTTIKQTNKKLSHLLLTDHKSGTHQLRLVVNLPLMTRFTRFTMVLLLILSTSTSRKLRNHPVSTSVNVSGLTCPFPSWSKWRKAQRTMSSEKRRGTPRWITRDSPRCESPLNRRFNRGFLVEEKEWQQN